MTTTATWSLGAVLIIPPPPQPGEAFHPRLPAPPLLVCGARVRAGPRGFAADVENLRSLVRKTDCVLHRQRGIEEPAAIGERVGRHVHDAHDRRSVEWKIPVAESQDARHRWIW